MNSRKINSPFSFFFDSSSVYWEEDSEDSLIFLKDAQLWANRKLKKDKYLFLNDILWYLGLKKTKFGQICGWIYDKNDPECDNFVDFGIYDINDEANRAFINGTENVILLDFNCDGVIIDRIDEKILPIM